MSEHKQDKWLYTFYIPKEIDVEKTVDEEVNGQMVKVTRKTKEVKQIRFALRRPNRRLYEKGDMFYGIQIGEGIRAGLLTRALLIKRYREDGGALSETDTKYLDNLTKELPTVENEYQRALLNLEKLSPEENKTRVEGLYEKKQQLVRDLQAFESMHRAIFAHTAEAKADIQMANWWAVHLAYWDPKEDGNFEEFFPGDDFKAKMEHWDKLFDEGETFSLEVLARFSLLIGVWNSGAQHEQDFKAAEQEQTDIPEKPAEPAPTPVTTNAVASS